MDVTLPVRRDAPQWAQRVAVCAAVALPGLLPLGVPYLSGAEAVVQTMSVRLSPPGAAVDALGAVLARVAVLLPLGDLSWRVGLVSALCTALALSILVRAALAVLAWLRPPAHARRTPADVAHEPVAALGAALAVACAPPLFMLALGAAGGGIPLLLLACWLWATICVLREASDARAALTASFLAGVAVADAPSLGALVLPCGAVIWAFGAARGARWAPLAPTFTALGLVLLLAAVVHGGVASTWTGWWDVLSLGVLRRAVALVSVKNWLEVAVALGESLGVVGWLLAVIGWGVLAWRASALAGVVLFVTWASLMMGASAVASPGQSAAAEVPLGLAIAGLALPMAVGIIHFANKLGRAHVAGAVALAVMAAVAPAAAGGSLRWWPEGRLPLRLLMRAHADLPPRATVNDAGSKPLDTLLRYGGAIGLRPDVTVSRARK